MSTNPDIPTPSDDSRTPAPQTTDSFDFSQLQPLAETIFQGLSEWKRAGLPSDELDRLKENHPEMYEIYVSEQREQPIHDRKMEEERLRLEQKQMEHVHRLQETQIQILQKSQDIQSRQLDIKERNAKVGRGLAIYLTIFFSLFLLLVFAGNFWLVSEGKYADFNPTLFIAGGEFLAGIFAVVRDMLGQRSKSSASPKPADND